MRKMDYTELYKLQDDVLKIIHGAGTGFYLSGGTAASRGYLDHRYSDDLDLFVNDADEFTLWCDRIVQSLNNTFSVDIHVKEKRFMRLFIQSKAIPLKLEFINDVPAHIGECREDEKLGLIDSAENILANKITAVIDRREPKDLADIWAFCTIMKLSLQDMLQHAQSKAAGIFPLILAGALQSVKTDDWEKVNWIQKPDPDQYIAELDRLGESLILLR